MELTGLLQLGVDGAAYLDPGTLTAVTAAIVSAFAGIGYWFKLKWRRIRRVFTGDDEEE